LLHRKQDNRNIPWPRRPDHGAVEKPQGWRASLALHFLVFLPSHGEKQQNKKRAPAGATEIIDHGKRLCRPLTRAEALTTPLSHGYRPRPANRPPILMVGGSKETIGHNHAGFRRGGS